jgi:hypothetical protein
MLKIPQRLVFGIHPLHLLYRLSILFLNVKAQRTLEGFGGGSDLKVKLVLSTQRHCTVTYFD